METHPTTPEEEIPEALNAAQVVFSASGLKARDRLIEITIRRFLNKEAENHPSLDLWGDPALGQVRSFVMVEAVPLAIAALRAASGADDGQPTKALAGDEVTPLVRDLYAGKLVQRRCRRILLNFRDAIEEKYERRPDLRPRAATEGIEILTDICSPISLRQVPLAEAAQV